MQSLRALLDAPTAREWPASPVPISLVITDLDVGGAEKAMTALATRLDRSRWRPSVIALAGEGALADPLREAGIPVVCLGVDRRRPVRAVIRLARTLREQRPALVQSFLFHANFAARMAAPLAGRPPVVGGLRVAEREKRWHLALDRLTQSRSVGAVCVSEAVRQFSIREGKIAADRLVAIPNGIDPAPYDRAEPANLGFEDAARVLLFVGRITAQKGVGLLLDAFAKIVDNRPDWRLVIAGEGPDRPALQGRSESDPSLRDRVSWLGRRNDVPSLLKRAGVLVLPSLWEGMPNVVLEAMAAGRPVLASDVEGVRDLVIPDGPEATGWIVRPADGPAWEEALRNVTNQCDRFETMGASGRKQIETAHGMASVVASYERTWAAILGLERVVIGRDDSP